MSLNADKDSQRRRRSDNQAETERATAPEPRARRKRAPSEIGDALRSAYQRTIDEDIPPEMLDLLGKLD